MNNSHNFLLPALIFSVAVGVLGLGFVAFGQTTSWFGTATEIDPAAVPPAPYDYGFFVDLSHGGGKGGLSGGLIVDTGGAATGLIVNSGNVGIGTQTPQHTLDVNGDISLSGGLTSTKPCISGFMRIGAWCYATTGNLISGFIDNTSTNDSSWRLITVHSGWKAIQFVSKITGQHAGNATLAAAYSCIIPGDDTTTPSCDPPNGNAQGADLYSNGNAERTSSSADGVVRLDNNGRVKVMCVITPNISSATCDLYYSAYLD